MERPNTGESTLRRNEAFEHNGVFLGALQFAVVVFLIVETRVGSGVNHCFESLKIHGMEHIAAVIVESKRRAVGIPTVASVPFLHLACSRVYTVYVEGRSSLA